MNKKIGIIAIVVIGALVVSGSAIAFADTGDENIEDIGEAKGYGRGPVEEGYRDEDGDGVPNGQDDDYERPQDGSNSPWVTGDERLDRFQSRFELSDNQITQLREEVQSLIEQGAGREEVQETVKSNLENWGIDSPQLNNGESNELGPKGNGRRGQAGANLDEDNDGVPNGQDEDYERPDDCEGYEGLKRGRGR